MKNSQVAVLCGAILGRRGDRRGTNVVARALDRDGSPACPRAGAITPAAGKPSGGRDDAESQGRPVLRQLPSRRRGSGTRVRRRSHLGRPDRLDAARQNELVESWITRRVDVIAVAVENRAGISTVLRKARERGIKVLTWDADAEPDARDFFVNQATAEGIGTTLIDEAARLMGGAGKFAIITGALTRPIRTTGSRHPEAARRQVSRPHAGHDSPERRRS